MFMCTIDIQISGIDMDIYIYIYMMNVEYKK